LWLVAYALFFFLEKFFLVKRAVRAFLDPIKSEDSKEYT